MRWNYVGERVIHKLFLLPDLRQYESADTLSLTTRTQGLGRVHPRDMDMAMLHIHTHAHVMRTVVPVRRRL